MTLVFLLSGCGLGDWVEGMTGRKEKLLPGQRIPVMINDPALEPDPRVADLRVFLPSPIENSNWSQAGGNSDHAMHHLRVSLQLRQAWEQSIGEGASDERRLVARPIVGDGFVFTMDAEFEVRAFEAASGKR